MAAATFVSLVVPVRNEAASVASLHRCIQQQVRRPDEVVIVDGGSTDGTALLLRGLIDHDARYRLIEAGPATPGRARNIGIEAATHPWVALTDAGIDLDRHWLGRLTRVVESDDQVDVVYGSVSPSGGSYFERCADLAYVPPLEPSPSGPVRSRSVASCLLRKEVWRSARGFPDLRAAEDLLFMRRLDALDCRIAAAPEARVTWHLQPTLRLTFQRFRHYSRHNVLAGQQRYWHYGVARQYLAAVGVILAARAVRRSPVPLLVTAGCLRVVRTTWRRREGRGVGWALRPDRMGTIAVILLTIDVATLVGWLEAYLPHGRFAPDA